ncbi:MAG: N-acetyltransferase family protein [Methanoregula sp.]|jgi:phosphinothricin acetyltransferase|nr:N-acetyltransferase family protein [Methanoregula sp.]
MSDIPGITFSQISETEREAVINLFNYYIEHSFAAYPEQKVPYEFYSHFLETCRSYPSIVARLADGSVAGFGLLRAHNPMPAFRHTAEITYFIRPDMTGRGLGATMLGHLEAAGKAQGISTILASISSLNEGSIRFHARNGFSECGRFVKVGIKKGVVFDTVWMQKII